VLIKAQREAAQFSALAAAKHAAGDFAAGAASGSAEGSAQGGAGVAAELERLAALHSSGMLDDEEFRAAKARILHGG
jgi:hypothetical protein